MANLVAATVFFMALHIGVSSTALRPMLVARIGENAYRGLFSLLALAGLVWMVLAYNAADVVVLWSGGTGGRHIAFVLAFFAFYLAVASVTTPNPTAAGAEAALQREHAVQGALKLTRHPLMWGIALWALAHIVANGHLAALIFFGGLGLLALVGSRLIDLKMARKGGEDWTRFAAETSWLPFLALGQRRTSYRLADLGWWRPALALALYLAFLFIGHEWLIGPPLIAI